MNGSFGGRQAMIQHPALTSRSFNLCLVDSDWQFQLFIVVPWSAVVHVFHRIPWDSIGRSSSSSRSSRSTSIYTIYIYIPAPETCQVTTCHSNKSPFQLPCRRPVGRCCPPLRGCARSGQVKSCGASPTQVEAGEPAGPAGPLHS